jgi:hypothetical protein
MLHNQLELVEPELQELLQELVVLEQQELDLQLLELELSQELVLLVRQAQCKVRHLRQRDRVRCRSESDCVRCQSAQEGVRERQPHDRKADARARVLGAWAARPPPAAAHARRCRARS